jgi:hypothetical protein
VYQDVRAFSTGSVGKGPLLLSRRFAQAERVADATEGVHHRRRQSVDLLRVVAELRGAGGADRGLLLLFGGAGDLGEALLEGSMEGFGVSERGTVLDRFCSARWSC